MAFENVVNVDSLEFTRVGSEAYQSEIAELSSTLDTKHLGFHVQILPPHMFSCPYHFHRAEEEFFLVLEGCATLRQKEGFQHVGPGDVIFCGLGEEHAHQLYNHTDEPFRFLALSTLAQWDVCEYPDSGKLNVRGLHRVFKLDSEVPYQEGEHEPRSFWPEDILAGVLPPS